MNYLIKPVLFLSALGFVFSLIAHISAIAGVSLNLGNWIFVLHVGIFVVWFPAMLLAKRLSRGQTNSTWNLGFSSLKHVLAGCPAWMIYLLFGLIAYVFLNFLLFVETAPAHHLQGDSQGTPEVIRGFSGHWLVFYYAAFAIAYSALMKPELLRDAKCKLGHKALPTDKFCSECGNPVVIN